MPDSRTVYEDLWSQGWKEECASPGASHRTRRRLFLSLFATIYHEGIDVLDVGCGNGLLLGDIAQRFPGIGSLSGTDISEKALELAVVRLPKASFFRCDPQTEDLPISKKFDIVTSCEVLEHIEDYRAALRRMIRAVKPGGHLLIAVPHSRKNWSPHDDAAHHFRRFEKDDLAQDLIKEGLEIVKVYTWGTLVYSCYYRFFLNRVRPETTWKPKSRAANLLHRLLYILFNIDDVLTWAGRGRMLFVVARKPG